MSNNIFQKTRVLFAELGLWNASLYGAAYLLRRISSRANIYKYALVAQAVRQEPLLPGRRHRGFTVRQISEAEYDLNWFPRPPAIIHSRYRQGAVCLVAFKDDAAIGCVWLSLGPYLEDEVRCFFVPQPANLAAWDFDVYLDPAYRATRAFACLWDAANAWLCDQGALWTMSRINAFNFRSLRSHQRLGAQQVGTALFICLGICQILLTTVRPYLHISCGDSLPQLVVKAPEHP